ncbi:MULTISPECIES: acyltransferase [unclassified Romboutsia]|uniref:acyltransferase n=1 Tax=unclassified Romboutsia TaxID=2626894 RepID=UPI0008223562|nr:MULTISPECIES: acyltransferase [unclassified Romboutsia]SCI26624.1 putative lipopolysaccharide biosynthesis O-acetyl transferase WbbJ [uncultured Clostridium sp.]
MNSFFSREELYKLGLKNFGDNVLISKKASIYNAENVYIGNNVRIDDFCILSGNIKIGSYVHISAYVGLFAGDEGIEINDFVSISSRCVIYAISDDYSGNAMANPMVDDKYRNIYGGKVILEKHSILGTGTTVLPSVRVKVGTAIGACSLIKNDCDEWSIYVGCPAVKIKNRSKNILELEKQMLIDKLKSID